MIADLDLTLDPTTLAAPGGEVDALQAADNSPDGTLTFTTTCWGTCAWTCGDCETISCCSC